MKSNRSNAECIIPEFTDSKSDLLKNIEDVKKAMDTAYTNFENLTEPELIDSCIYELQAIQMRYQYLLNLAKAKNLMADIKKNKYD